MKLCDLNTAKALQELGYDGYYNYIYAKNTESSLRYIGFKEAFELSEYTGPPAPRLYDVACWLRVKHKISIEPMYLSMAQEWRLAAYNMIYEGVDPLCVVYDKDYGSAFEAVVKKAIEIIKNRKQKIMDTKGRYRKELAKAIKKMKSTNPKSNKLKTNDRRTTTKA